MMIVSINKAIYTVINLLLCIFVVMNNTDGFIVPSVLILLQLLFFFIFNFKTTGEILDYSLLFIVLLFVFHFGQVILLGIFPNATINQQITIQYFNEGECLYAIKVLSLMFSMLCLGVIVSNKRVNRIHGYIVINKYSKYKSCYAISKNIILLTMPFKITIDILFWYISVTQGHLSGLNFLMGLPNFLVVYSNFSIIGLLLYLISFVEYPHKQIRVLGIIIFYFLLLMLSGRRSENVVYISLLAYFFVKTYKDKVNIKKILIGIILSYLFLTFLFTIVYTRSSVGEQDITVFIKNFYIVLKERNILVEALREYGNTGYTAICVSVFWLKYNIPDYGISIISSMAAILPNFGNIAGSLSDYGNYALQLQKNQMLSIEYTNIGGSILGELLYNFGNTGGVIASMFVGLVIGCINNKSKELLLSCQFMKLAYYIPVMIATLYWIRDVFGGGIRIVIWSMLFLWFVRNYIMDKRR